MFFNPRSSLQRPLTKEQVAQKVGKSIDLILQDWIQVLHPNPSSHDYSGIYSPSVSFRIAHDQLIDSNDAVNDYSDGGSGGFHLKGRLYFKTAHKLGKCGLRFWIGNRYSRPRITCFPESTSQSTSTIRSLSFRWLIEGVPESQGKTGHSLIIGGMAHYRFAESDGKVESILIDRLIPPFRPGLTILEYLRSVRLQHTYSINK